MRIRDFLLGGTALTMTVGLAHQAFAQAPEGAGIGDIVVTAQKRAENVQDTPVAVTAVSQDTLNRQGVKDITDLSRVAPEVQVQSGTFNVVQIRGLRVGSYGPTTDSPNAVHLDGAYLARYTGLGGFFYDLERVEALSGPQGTLYGRNSVGGTINIITHKPDIGKNGGMVSVDIGNYNSLIAQGAVNLALSDDAAVRIAAYRNRHDGYFTDTNQQDADQEGYRASLKWQPTEQDTFLVSGDYEHVGGHSGASSPIISVLKNPYIATVTGFTGGSTLAQQQANPIGSVSLSNINSPSCAAGTTCSFATVPISATQDIRKNAVVAGGAELDRQNTSSSGYGAQWDHDFDFATLTVQGSYRTTDTNNLNGTSTGARQDPRLLPLLFSNTGIGATIAHSEWHSEEIRLTSNDSAQKTLRYTVGLYRFYENSHDSSNPTYASWYSNSNSIANPGQPGVVGVLNVPQPYVIRGVTDNRLNDTTSFAVFGQATYTPQAWDALHVTLGARYNWEEKHGIAATYAAPTVTAANPPSVPGIVVLNTNFDETKDWERATYKANVSYDLTKSNMLYADYSTGFVSGGFAYGIPPNASFAAPQDHSYKPMTIESYEVGSKNRFFDDHLQVNLSAFKYDFVNYLTNQAIQVPTGLAPPNDRQAYITVANAGATEFKGINGDVSVLVTQDDRFHVNAQYLESHVSYALSDYYYAATQSALATLGLPSDNASVLTQLAALNPGTAYPSGFNPEGPLGRPKWTANADYTHTFHVASGALDAQLTGHYQSETDPGVGVPLAPAINFQYRRIPPRTTFDASFRYQRDDAAWSVTAYVRNLTDRKYFTAHGVTDNFRGAQPYPAALSNPGLQYAYETGTYGDPRTFGVSFQSTF